MAKDVHTEHCCIVHGCKYCDPNCTVTTKKQPQSFPCESCEMDGIDPSKADPETSIFNLLAGKHYKYVPPEGKEGNPALLYVMGYLRDAQGENCLIANIFLCSDFLATGKIELTSSIQGTKRIMPSEWVEVSKEEFEKLKVVYDKQLKGIE